MCGALYPNQWLCLMFPLFLSVLTWVQGAYTHKKKNKQTINDTGDIITYQQVSPTYHPHASIYMSMLCMITVMLYLFRWVWIFSSPFVSSACLWFLELWIVWLLVGFWDLSLFPVVFSLLVAFRPCCLQTPCCLLAMRSQPPCCLPALRSQPPCCFPALQSQPPCCLLALWSQPPCCLLGLRSQPPVAFWLCDL